LAWLTGIGLTAAGQQVPINLPTPDSPAPAHLSGFVLVKSEFINDPRFGKDPFYPKSIRRNGMPVIPNTDPVLPNAPDLTLKGISGSREKPLAIINNRTFAVGETAEMRVKGQIVKVQCIEINDKSVKITVNGIPKELSRF
jgi:hypothetical protein